MCSLGLIWLGRVARSDTASFGSVSGVQLTLAWLELAVLVLSLVAFTTGYLACLFTLVGLLCVR